MQKQVGLWIDHRKAVIVTIQNKVEATQVIDSNMEKHVRFSNSTPTHDPSNSQGSTAEDVRDRQFGNHLEKFYELIASTIHDADLIWIFGPGEAKVELEHYMKNHSFCGKITNVEPADKLTDKQVASKVRLYFKENRS
jgi:hypothetical protein